MEGPVSGRRIKRRTVRNIFVVIVAVFVIISVVAGVMYVSGRIMEKSREQETANLEHTAQQIANEISRPLHSILEQSQQIADSAALADLLENADATRLTTEAEVITTKVKYAIKARLFTPGSYKLDRESKPPLGYASIDILRKAEGSGHNPAVELHNFGSADAHIVLVRRITDTEGELAGLLHISLDPKSLIQMPAQAGAINGYAELVQGSGKTRLVLNSAGNKHSQQGQPVSVNIPGTQWRIDYWPKGSMVAMNEGQGFSVSTLLYVFVIIVLPGLLGGLWYLRRQRPAESPAENNEGIVYGGAIKAIMEGLHPGLEKLLPNLPGMGQRKPVKPVSQGLDVEDATRVIKPEAVTKAPVKPETKQPSPPEMKNSETAPATDQTPAVKEQTTAEEPKADESVQLSPVIFRAYDIRGVVGKTLAAAGVT